MILPQRSGILIPIDAPDASNLRMLKKATVLTRPPNGTPRRAIGPGEGLPISYAFLGGSGRRLPFTARIERAPFHRARSASKKGTWPLPPHSSQAARCASTGIVPATPPTFSASC